MAGLQFPLVLIALPPNVKPLVAVSEGPVNKIELASESFGAAMATVKFEVALLLFKTRSVDPSGSSIA